MIVWLVEVMNSHHVTYVEKAFTTKDKAQAYADAYPWSEDTFNVDVYGVRVE